MSKNRLIKYIGLVLALVLFVALPAGLVKASSEYPDLSGTGSVNITLTGRVGNVAPYTIVPIEGGQYDVYQIWSLDEEGVIKVNAPFDEAVDANGNILELNGEDLHETLETGRSEEFLKRVDAYSMQAFLAEPMLTTDISDAEGKIRVTDLPMGGYLFLSKGPIVDPEDDSKSWNIADFMISVPVLTDSGEWLTNIDATPKTFVPRRGEVKPDYEFEVVKVDVTGGLVQGAELKIVARGDDAAAEAVTNLSNNQPAEWTSGNGPELMNLPEGDYTLYEISAPENYGLIDPLNFHVDEYQGVTAFDSNWNPITTNTDASGLAVGNEGQYVNGAAGEIITVADPIEIIKKVNDKNHEDLSSKDEVFEYKITTLVPGAAKKSFKVIDRLEPVLEFVLQAEGGFDNALSIKIGDEDWTDVLSESVDYDLDSERQCITVTLKGDDLENAKGQKFEMTFLAKIKKGADLSPYSNETIPNEASYQIDNFPEEKSNPVTVKPPRDKETTTTKVSKKSPKTGDDTPIGLYAALLGAAVVTGAIVVAKRRKKSVK